MNISIVFHESRKFLTCNSRALDPGGSPKQRTKRRRGDDASRRFVRKGSAAPYRGASPPGGRCSPRGGARRDRSLVVVFPFSPDDARSRCGGPRSRARRRPPPVGRSRRRSAGRVVGRRRALPPAFRLSRRDTAGCSGPAGQKRSLIPSFSSTFSPSRPRPPVPWHALLDAQSGAHTSHSRWSSDFCLGPLRLVARWHTPLDAESCYAQTS